MNVPPFIPPQIEISGNVAEERYLVRTVFVKRVTGLHTAFCGIILGVALFEWPPAEPVAGLILTVVALLALSLVRGLAKGWRHEQVLSSVCVPALVAGIAILIRVAPVPFWVFGVAPLSMLAYTLFCGRDLSFLGMLVMGSLAVVASMVAGWGFGELSASLAFEAGAVLIAYLLFFVYDLAALQTRRRSGEEFGAVLDLFRDVLNFTTYPIRVINHWRRHRIWSLRG